MCNTNRVRERAIEKDKGKVGKKHMGNSGGKEYKFEPQSQGKTKRALRGQTRKSWRANKEMVSS